MKKITLGISVFVLSFLFGQTINISNTNFGQNVADNSAIVVNPTPNWWCKRYGPAIETYSRSPINKGSYLWVSAWVRNNDTGGCGDAFF